LKVRSIEGSKRGSEKLLAQDLVDTKIFIFAGIFFIAKEASSVNLS